jgi:tetratricopeptide (TPR) repeat protein
MLLVGPAAAAEYPNCNERSDPDQAIADCSRWIEDVSQPSWAGHVLRGLAWQRKGDLARALADFDRAVEIDPGREDAWRSRGRAHLYNHDYDRAIHDLDRALRLKPQEERSYYLRGDAWREKGDHDKAIADYDAALRLNPQDAETLRYRGTQWTMKGDHDKAIADYDAALRLNPQDAETLRCRGDAWRRKGDPVRALADFDRAVAATPEGDSTSLSARGRLHLAAGRPAAAAADFAAAAAIKPDPYTAIWRYLAAARSDKQAAAVALRAGQAPGVRRDWPDPVIGFLIGDLTAQGLYAAARDPDARKATERRCEASYFQAQAYQLSGEGARARPLLEAAVKICPRSFFQYTEAMLELRRLAGR